MVAWFFFPIFLPLFKSVGGFSWPFLIDFRRIYECLFHPLLLLASTFPYLLYLALTCVTLSFPLSSSHPIYFPSVILNSDLYHFYSDLSPRSLACINWDPVVVNTLHGVIRVSIYLQYQNVFLAVTLIIEMGVFQDSASSFPYRLWCTYPVDDRYREAGNTQYDLGGFFRCSPHGE